MNLKELLHDEVATLSDELRDNDKLIRDCARRGDEAGLVALRSRRDALPELIHQAKLRRLSQRINEARTRWGCFDNDAQNAARESQQKNAELEPKVRALDEAKAQLINEAGQAMTDHQNLQFAARQALEQFEGLLRERERLLLERHS